MLKGRAVEQQNFDPMRTENVALWEFFTKRNRQRTFAVLLPLKEVVSV